MPDQLFLFDTVSLSNFALSESLDLLVSRYGDRLTVTNEVLDEVTEGVAAGYCPLSEILNMVDQGIFLGSVLTREERVIFAELIDHLGSGEASCVAAASCRCGIVVTDDRAARNSCAKRNVPFTGTVGVLKAMCIDGQLSAGEADQLLSSMISRGFYSPVSRIRDVL